VALGLFLVRRSADVVGGSTISLRVLPALLSVAAIAAWLLGRIDPMLGAALPLGGAIVATGGTWDGPWPALLAATSTATVTAALVLATIRDLSREIPSEQPFDDRLRTSLWATALGMLAWWTPIAGPLLWAIGGNPDLARELERTPGVVAGSLLLLIVTVVRVVRSEDSTDELGLRIPVWRDGGALALAVVVGGLLALASGVSAWAWTGPAWAADLHDRFAGAAHPTAGGLGVLLLAIAAQELLFRGWLRHTTGPLLSTLIATIVLYPLDPLRGLLVGGLLAVLVDGANGLLWPALVARLVAAGVMAAAPALVLPPAAAMAVAVAGIAGLVAWKQRVAPRVATP
jgi:hypothetical protein